MVEVFLLGIIVNDDIDECVFVKFNEYILDCWIIQFQFVKDVLVFMLFGIGQ